VAETVAAAVVVAAAEAAGSFKVLGLRFERARIAFLWLPSCVAASRSNVAFVRFLPTVTIDAAIASM
jgi:hypothetical protein